jgi:hypothetical protein
MHQRVHILALRETGRQALLDAYPKAAQLDLTEENGWLWLAVPVWNATQEELAAVAKRCGAAALIASALESGRWLLRLLYTGGDTYTLLHEYMLLEVMLYGDGDSDDAPEGEDVSEEYPGWHEGVPMPMTPMNFNEAPAEAIGEGMTIPDTDFFAEPRTGNGVPHFAVAIQRDLRSFGCPMPEEVYEEVRALRGTEAMETFLDWQADDLCDALETFGVEHSPEEVLDIITGESVTLGELDTELGNLPRLLIALGIESGFDAWLEDNADEYEDEYDEEQEIEEQLEDIAYLVSLTSRLAPRTIPGEAIPISVDDIASVARIAWFADPSCGAALKYVLPGEADIDAHEPPETFLPGAYGGERPMFPEGLFGSSRERRDLARDLGQLPEGTLLEMLTGSETYDAGRMIFRGRLSGGIWNIREIGPAFPRAKVLSALELARAFHGNTPLPCESDKEVEEGIRYAGVLANLGGPPPHCVGLGIQCTPEQRPWVALAVFRERFRGLIDTEAVMLDERVAYEEAKEVEREMRERTSIAVSGKPVLKSDVVTYHKADATKLEFAGDRRGALHLIKLRDTEMQEAGFAFLGDLVCSRNPDTLVRCYRSGDGLVLATQQLNLYGLMHRELYSQLSNGGSLTTTAGGSGESIPHRKIVERVCGEDDLNLLQRDHAAGLQLLAPSGAKAEPIGSDLPAAAAALEDYSQRRFG